MLGTDTMTLDDFANILGKSFGDVISIYKPDKPEESMLRFLIEISLKRVENQEFDVREYIKSKLQP